MAITVQCSCGKRSTVGDPLAGKTIRCPGCSEELYVPASTTPGGAKKPGKAPRAGPAVHVSSGTITLLSIGGVLGLIIIMFLSGPMRVWHKWEAMGEKAKDNVTDVVTFAIQSYLSERGGYDPSKPHQRPGVDDVMFYRPFLTMSMPEKVKFHGTTNQGSFEGFYYVNTGEIEANVEYGGYSHGGVKIGKATGAFPITGRMGPDNQPHAETNSVPLQLVYPKHVDE